MATPTGNKSLTLPSFAKINLSLRILGKREDGYHELVTILQTISLHDDVTFIERFDDQIVLHCDSPDIPADNSNLIVRAALLLREQTGLTKGVDVFLTKRIPAKGGLGGASSNGAIALLALNYLWATGLSNNELELLGQKLGSDVPFFFLGGTARAEGTGVRVSPLPDNEKVHLLVVTPSVGVSTADAYASLNAPSLTTSGSVSILSSSFREPPFYERDQWALYNDFEGVIFEIEPEIKRAKVALLESGAQGGLLAGSGSSVFGVFETEAARERALAVLKREQGWRIFSCDTISRSEYSDSLNSSGFPLFTLS